MTNSGTITISSGANRNDRIVNITSFEPRYCQRPAAYAAGMPITSDTITAPTQLTTLVKIACVKLTLVKRVPSSESTMAKFSRVGVNAKYVLICSALVLSASSTIQTSGNSENTNHTSSAASAPTDAGENRRWPGPSSLAATSPP